MSETNLNLSIIMVTGIHFTSVKQQRRCLPTALSSSVTESARFLSFLRLSLCFLSTFTLVRFVLVFHSCSKVIQEGPTRSNSVPLLLIYGSSDSELKSKAPGHEVELYIKYILSRDNRMAIYCCVVEE